MICWKCNVHLSYLHISAANRCNFWVMMILQTRFKKGCNAMASMLYVLFRQETSLTLILQYCCISQHEGQFTALKARSLRKSCWSVITWVLIIMSVTRIRLKCVCVWDTHILTKHQNANSLVIILSQQPNPRNVDIGDNESNTLPASSSFTGFWFCAFDNSLINRH